MTPALHRTAPHQGRTHEARLCTPSFCSLILAVFEKNLGVKSGRYRVFAAGAMEVAVRKRAVVSNVLEKVEDGAANMVYIYMRECVYIYI